MTSLKGNRAVRQAVLACVDEPRQGQAWLELLQQVSTRQLLRPLMSFLRSADERTKYGAVEGIGRVTAELAQTDLEAARDVVRRLMLTLTEESGGIGWGSPEAIGEILARTDALAEEFTNFFISYARVEEEVYLDHEPLQRGVLWGLGRLAESKPQLLAEKGLAVCLQKHLESKDPMARTLATRALDLLGTP